MKIRSSAAEDDRLNLLQACKTNLSPIWLLYSDPQNAILGLLENAVKGKPAQLDFHDDSGCRQRLGRSLIPRCFNRS